jgi:hypothetical protein
MPMLGSREAILKNHMKEMPFRPELACNLPELEENFLILS